jgi:hypothetical protein
VAFVGAGGLGFSVGVSVEISSMGLGAGVVATVYPIHAPIAIIAIKAIATGTAISQKRTVSIEPILIQDIMYG